jgi:Tfp pilus assembly protein PilX
MMLAVSKRAQRGVTLAVGLIMLFVITVMVVAAFKLSTINLAAVGNMQFREQALAAADLVINNEADGSFQMNSKIIIPPDTKVDIDGDGNPDFNVHFNAISCLRASPEGTATSSSVTLPVTMTTLTDYNSVWDFDVTATDATAGTTGASVHVHQGVRVKLTQAQCDALCPPAIGTPCS